MCNLIDNAFTYGGPLAVIRLLTTKDSTSLEIWDEGSDVPTAQWRAVPCNPFRGSMRPEDSRAIADWD